MNNAAATQLAIGEYIIVLEGESKNVRADDRPESVAIPDPQNFKIPAYYKGNPIEITGVLAYNLNPDYYPKKYAETLEFCFNWPPRGQQFSYEGIVVLSIIGIIGLIVLYKNTKHKNTI